MNKLSEIQIIPIKPQNGLIGFASFILDDKVYFGSIGIFTKLGGGYRLTYPTKKVGDKNMNIYHPINKDLGLAIEQAVLRKANEIFEKCNEIKNDRYINIINS